MDDDQKHTLTSHIASYWRVKTVSYTIKGERWSCITQGDPNAEPIIFLHGLGTNKSLWRSQMQSYDNKDYYRIALNIPGACLTQYFNERSHTLHELCRWLDDTLDWFGFKKVNIVAHSMISLLSTFYAATRQDRVKTLTLISIPDLWGSGEGGAKSRDITKKMRGDIDHQSVDDTIEFISSLFYNPPILPKALYHSSFLRIKKFIDKFSTVLDDLEQGLPLIMPQTKNIKCPLLIINGERDPYSSKEFIESLHWHYPTVNAVNLLQCAHLLMVEKPIELHKIHAQFLNHGYVTTTSEYSDIIHTQLTFQPEYR